jgi:hypothetical protein
MQIHQIPSQFVNRDSLYKYIIPPDTISWWKSGIVNLEDGKTWDIFCSDPSKEMVLQHFTSNNTYSSVFYNSFLISSYLVYKTKCSKITYVYKIEQIPDFIGDIDNLAEALFMASLYGYKIGFNENTKNYSYKDGVYTFNLVKITDPPDVFLTYIDEKGKEIIKEEIVTIKVYTSGDVFKYDNLKKEFKKLKKEDMYRLQQD